MWALIAFIALGIIVAALIEINERMKKRRKSQEDCQQDEAVVAEDCASCELMAVCEKKEKKD